MTVTRTLVLLLSLSCAFLLGREFARRGVDRATPGAGYAVQVAQATKAAGALDQSPAQPITSFVEVADRLRPSVVSIHGVTAISESDVQRHAGAADSARLESSGTGIVVSEDGAILTNYHVVEGLTDIVVTLSSLDNYPATLVGKDEPTDLALLRVDGLKGLHPATFGESDELRIGEDVLAIGNALGFGWTATRGIVSSLHRSQLALPDRPMTTKGGPAPYTDFVQIDAAINPGNSGGPVLNARGEVIGVSTAILARRSEGIGFAIPSNDARFVADSLIQRGEVLRGYLGVASKDLCTYSNTDRRRLAPGALGGAVVTEVMRATPAERAGILMDDVILAVDGRPVESQSMLRNRVARIPPQTEVRVLLVRDGREREIAARLGAYPKLDGDG